MKSYELRISPEAERCIEDQFQWYEANDAAELADRWMDLLETALDALMRCPEGQESAPENGRWMPDVAIRQMRFKPWKTPSVWRILFVIDENARLVTVLQIRHEKRSLLGDETRSSE